MSGPLTGLRVVEFAGIGPAPFGVMLLADMGADVVRIERAGQVWPDVPVVSRGRASVRLDLKQEAGLAVAREALRVADVLVEGFRPGVMERLGLGPEAAMRLNPRLIYARMTGWGQEGPLAQRAGHDLNYIGLVGLLAMLKVDGKRPNAPLNLLGDYGGGGLYLAFGVVCALLERERSGKGQVVDAAVVDGAASLMAPILGMVRAGLLPSDPAEGMLAGGAPYYRTYRCADGKDIAVGPLEAGFRKVLTDALDLEPGALDGEPQAAAARLEQVFAGRPRDAWAALFEGLDACVSPVLTVDEAAAHPHLEGRGSFEVRDGAPQPAPAPRLSRTPGAIQPSSADGLDRLGAWGAALGPR